MIGAPIEQRSITLFHDFTMEQYDNAITDISGGCQIMGNEHGGEVHTGLQFLQKIQNLGLNRNVKRTYRLIKKDEFWVSVA